MSPNEKSFALAAQFLNKYDEKNSVQLKVCDAFIVFFALNVVVLCLYCFLVGSYPFNAYLSALFANLGMVVFTVSLRMQAAPANKPQFQGISAESSFGEYCVCSLLILFTAVHFMG
eukprot:TRINITY_DN26348_c0_g1_i1.p2 TRINITY_DN26348_c0_g1~~TRINITY_DN26348_c0_g1_i1.p2  ORF type:complete len:116 (+),score=37.11 TRINITY_DN26348_c0_g1_i1:57-404(+)